VDGIDTSGLSDAQLSQLRNEKIGIVFQSYNLIQRMTALENVALPLIAAGVPREERHRRARETLELVGLGDRLVNRPVELSGGEQQRVSIARALVKRPTILLGDEPTGNLDTKTTDSVIGLFQQINRERGVTTVLITHDLSVAARTRRIIRVRDGLVESDGPAEAAPSTLPLTPPFSQVTSP
jgi:predicted ABC-type transport system involved in lysophospholipase L1 biosynthesis ATPase subunit